MPKIISYLRVSTKAQGQSGLGLAAQRSAVEAYAKRTKSKILGEYVEVESGRKTAKDRPKLRAALRRSRGTRAVLVVAKLDRLARNVNFLSNLMDSGVEFVACDLPGANKVTLHIMAALAESEAEMISARTKVGLAEAKKRGVLLGSARPGHWDGVSDSQPGVFRRYLRSEGLKRAVKAAAKANAALAEQADSIVIDLITEARECGASYARIARQLNGEGYLTRRRGAYRANTVRNIYLRRAA